jgi:hypothetical protein
MVPHNHRLFQYPPSRARHWLPWVFSTCPFDHEFKQRLQNLDIKIIGPASSRDTPLLESYHPYLLLKKVLKNSKIYCIHSNLPKPAKTHFG